MTDKTNTNRWTAELEKDGSLWFACIYYGGRRFMRLEMPCRDAAVDLVDRINNSAPTAPADDLPPGVERISDGTYLCRGIDIPEGWDFYGPAESIAASEDESRPWWDWRDRETDVRTGHVYYQVRPITPAEPATEWVPWWEALRDRRTLACGTVATDTGLPDDGSPGRWVGKWRDESEIVRADGKVEVQR